MSALVVDTSVWVTFFRGQGIARLEQALSDGDVVLAPIVAAELGSAPLATPERRKLDEFLRDLPLAPTPLDHWLRVGALRAAAARKGLAVSTPDAHVAQVALDLGGAVWSEDQVFARLAAKSLVRAFAP
ncbi:MAG TPA: PIN domain-containing protein [Polyangia bacterium]|nr:PIN domain-containing protein [Polyangia bacterium]